MAGCLLYALALNLFYESNRIAAGGLAGIAVILRHFFPVRLSVLVLVMNLPLLGLGAFAKGVSFIRNTAISALLYHLLVEATQELPSLDGHPLLAAILGGIFMGVGMACMAYGNSSIGGTELIIRVLVDVVPHGTIGRLCMAVDGSIALVSMLAFGDVAAGMYALLALAATSLCSDFIMKRILPQY